MKKKIKKKKMNEENIQFQVEAILGQFSTHVRIHTQRNKRKRKEFVSLTIGI